MLRRALAVGLVSWMAVAVAAVAWADEADEEMEVERSGFYVGAAGVLTSGIGDNSGDNPGGFNMRAGYFASSSIALEILAELTTAGGGTIADTWNVSGNMKWYPHLFGRWQPFIGYGVGVMGASTGTDFAFRGGVGLDYLVTEHWVGFFETTYVHGVGSVDDSAYVSLGLGLAYQF